VGCPLVVQVLADDVVLLLRLQGVATVTFKRRVAGGRLELLFRNHMFVLNGSSRPLQATVRPPEETDCLRGTQLQPR
jgi:hypothetical protein